MLHSKGKPLKKLIHFSCFICLAIGLPSFIHADLVPVHVFPDATSDVITHLEIPREKLQNYPRVLDASLQTPWYWTTHEGEFIGYVSKRHISGKNRLKPKTLIRMDPTYSSWILTQYEPGDDIRVRSRLSVGRVSIKKQIPVYFRVPKGSEPISSKPVEPSNEPSPKKENTEREFVFVENDPGLPEVEKPLYEAPEEPQPELAEINQDPGPDETLDQDTTADESMIETPAVDETSEAVKPVLETPVETRNSAPLNLVPELVENDPDVPEEDPLLEETPKIEKQTLANMAPPPSSLFQEFEGFLRVVPEDDPQAEIFDYQLETRSGRRIVYVATRALTTNSYENLVNSWISIRGTLEETQPEFVLFIQAHNIRKGPKK